MSWVSSRICCKSSFSGLGIESWVYMCGQKMETESSTFIWEAHRYLRLQTKNDNLADLRGILLFLFVCFLALNTTLMFYVGKAGQLPLLSSSSGICLSDFSYFMHIPACSTPSSISHNQTSFCPSLSKFSMYFESCSIQPLFFPQTFLLCF